ncbi:MAG: hypothetical protein WD825_01525 [Gemmatimonadaceae bacterium]
MIGAADAAMNGPMSDAAMKHMLLSPTRKVTREDSVRAKAVASQLRAALAKYADTAAAVADGYKMFAPKLKQQRVFHFTNYQHAFLEAFRFDPDKPTSLLYRPGANGKLELIGAMYTAPKRMGTDKLDERVPLSIARWHKHVNWCVPPLGKQERWLERRDGQPVFGPESSIASRKACREVGGRFLASPMGWMIHANVFLGEDPGTVWGHGH